MLSLADAGLMGPSPLTWGAEVEVMGVPFVVGAGILVDRGQYQCDGAILEGGSDALLKGIQKSAL